MELETIYITYMNDIYRYLYSLTKNHTTAEDLLQDTFTKAHITLLGQEIQDIKPWLFKVAYYTYIDSTRKELRYMISDNVDQIYSTTPEQIIVEQDAYLKLLSLLEQIKPIEKQIILLCDVNDCTNEQAANILNLKLNTLKSHLARGRKKMRALIVKEE
ncbi:sigma-70 family RNA polymerase sigma factor [Viridibacillus sp. FSL R5-0477]|uniref:RNA polymerase sigma factor SigM n=1 Tax=Viridibacillus arenosi FSL R5-213 TaxID=1227360 RepID=W4F138_9BACL|nr:MULTISPECIES: sigma-70 family RNA polymerase sigma factor [Viridibacillus]ETT86184.1 RNA polymerase sigma factor SigM [Viridibacillus arenosi FSL R5-213]OMC84910.1 RNA polymerase subunit sigma [Viridibacillus sp. FSL H8-0123]OMC91959.1 RNA polymerase subunit sigma [Viridibacillus arenosi]